MIGYKAFDENLQCRGFQFEVGKTYETGKTKEELELCTDTVFHFCRELQEIPKVSNYNISKSRVCEVIAEGDVVTDDHKYGTNKLFILREIPREELNKYNNKNSGYCNSGYFNTDSPLVRIFNKETNVPRDDIDFPSFLYFDLVVWVSYDTATEEEKEEHKIDIETCGGFLKTLSYKEAFRIAWDKADKEEHRKLLNLPNWNNEIFMEISGIDAESEIAKEDLNDR